MNYLEALSPEILNRRSTAIIQSYRSMVAFGLPMSNLRLLEERSPSHHRDMLQVYLGIKPQASGLRLKEYFQRPDNLFRLPQEKDTGIQVLFALDQFGEMYVWNPDLVDSVWNDNNDLAKQFLQKTSGLRGKPDFHSRQGFMSLLSVIARLGNDKDAITLDGVLLGYPRPAAELFGTYHDTMIKEAARLWRENSSRKIRLTVGSIPPKFPLELVLDETKRREFIELAKFLGQVDPGLLDYVINMRPTTAPGFPYLTKEGSTNDHEQRQSKLYRSSKMEEKLQVFLQGII